MAMRRINGASTGARGRLAVVLAVAFLVAGAAVLVAQVNNATVDVQVADNQKVALPGVTVTVSSKATGFERRAITDAAGRARVAAVPPGTYELKLELDGFMPMAEEQLVLRVGQLKLVNATMLPRKTEQVTVTGSAPLVDTVKTDASTNVVPEQIELLPVADRQFERLAFITPGVQRERGDYRFISGGPVIGAGSNASQSTIMVDGVDFTDQALGLARTRFSQDAIREFKVVTSRFDTEIGGSAGGALNIVTRTGSNQLAGTAFAYYRGNSLRAKGALEKESPAYKRGQYGFTLGGPIVKDRTHYFLSGEYVNEDNIALFRPSGAFASRAKDVSVPFTQTLLFAGVDHAISPSQQLNGKLVYERYRQENFRVGGVADQDWGQQLNRDNWNATLEHTLLPSDTFLNEVRVQFGSRSYEEPPNVVRMEEWFSAGNTLKTGTNTTGDLLGKGDIFELRETARYFQGAHDFKAGFSFAHLKERSRIDTFQEGLMLYLNDPSATTPATPLAYSYGIGSSDVTKSTDLWGVFVQDDWRLRSNLTVNAGLRYDLDTAGNNPDFRHTLVPNGRSRDTNNWQPRLGFSWDVAGNGKAMVRGGWGRFTGRYLLIPAFVELQQNGETGRRLFTRLNVPPYFPLDPKNPTTTGYLLKPQISLIDARLDSPEADQSTLGFMIKLGNSGLYFDTEATYVKGRKEIVVRDTNFVGNRNYDPKKPIRINTNYDQINTYTNDGRSEYKAVTFSVNGVIGGGHLLNASFTVSDKKNIADDFSPEFPTGYPSDPANIDAEWGHSRSHERYRAVVSGAFRLPWDVTVAPIVEYGSGQPWTKRLGYDYNGDGKNSDRAAGVERFGEAGPPFRQVSLRLIKGLKLGDGSRLEIIAEGFNVFNTVNYDVNSVDGAQYYAGPTLANPAAAYVANPNFGVYRATLKSREVQLGLRLSF